MVIGPDFVYAHIPKTGGDAVHQYFSLIADASWVIDDTTKAEKHLGIVKRGNGDKRHRILSFRRLPSWSLSFLHALTAHPNDWPPFGWHSAEDILRPETALMRPWADEWLARVTDGLPVTHWLRMESLAEDFIAVLSSIVRPLSTDEQRTIRQARTKPPREYDHNPGRFWSEEQIAELYRMNPAWADIERKIYDRPLPCQHTLRMAWRSLASRLRGRLGSPRA